MILVIPNAQTPINQLIEPDIDSLQMEIDELTKDLFVVRDAPKIEFKRFDTLLPSIKEQIEKEHYALLVDCRSVEPTDTDTDFYVAYHPDYVQLTLIEQLQALCRQIGYSLTISTDYQPHPALNGIANVETLLVGINRQRCLSDDGKKSQDYGKMKRVLYTLMKEIHRYEIGQRIDAKRKHLSQQERDDEGESLMFASFDSKRQRNQQLFDLIDDPNINDEQIVAYIKQTYDFMIDEVVWVATHVCDLTVELINQRLETSLNNFIHFYRTLDTRSPTRAPSPSGILKSELEHCLYWGRCNPSNQFITQSADDET
ncbi:MAG TPA: hypothetical protein PLU46_05390 [Thiotrichales bacterium]|nr:hypothetical protein [Thiotrichales bacterium]HQT04408.1 hypothetical protein [Thiotrichales bacterium]